MVKVDPEEVWLEIYYFTGQARIKNIFVFFIALVTTLTYLLGRVQSINWYSTDPQSLM